MKKLTAILFACTMFICAAVSCGDSKDKSSNAKESKTEATTEAETTTEASGESKDDKDDKGDSTGVTSKEVTGDTLKEVDEALRKFAEVTLTGEVDGLLNSMYPSSVVEALKNSQYADTFAEASDLMGDSGKLVDCKAENVKELDETAISGSEKYFESIAQMFGVENFKAEVEKGYFLDMNIQLEKDGVKDGSTEETCLVYLKGDGWKVVPVDPADLVGIMSDPQSDPFSEDTAEAETTSAE
ncbi:hypothetical protein [Ruminococcus flavefaciens]|uniref:DUF5105 domain-containing protein n=1 Tax=Ruminococcus flavefaciens TaxID=1265 RepID=A0A1M7L8K2_RUMFL|nr:hypothetical protein [Ruminococcus flavefaciens]SHM74389.1 hypothetical protein SAMN04487860_11246 [Ruminococcus flavefaciens]